MSYLEDTIDWQFIHIMDVWLDGGVSQPYKNQPLAQDYARITKIGEEMGEAIQALIACTGQNPRKGTSGTMDDVYDELADVVITGLLAIQHFTKNSSISRQIIMQRMQYREKRMVLPNEAK